MQLSQRMHSTARGRGPVPRPARRGAVRVQACAAAHSSEAVLCTRIRAHEGALTAALVCCDARGESRGGVCVPRLHVGPHLLLPSSCAVRP